MTEAKHIIGIPTILGAVLEIGGPMSNPLLPPVFCSLFSCLYLYFPFSILSRRKASRLRLGGL